MSTPIVPDAVRRLQLRLAVSCLPVSNGRTQIQDIVELQR